MAVLLISLTACSNPSNQLLSTDADYNTTCDVNITGWGETDSLIFPLVVTTPATIRTPIQLERNYRLCYGIRITSQYPYTTVPMQLSLQQTDTQTDGQEHVIRNLVRTDIHPAVRDSLGKPLGSTWGSLIDYEALIPDLSLRFDSAGTYRIILTPHTDGAAPLKGISSVGISLVK